VEWNYKHKAVVNFYSIGLDVNNIVLDNECVCGFSVLTKPCHSPYLIIGNKTCVATINVDLSLQAASKIISGISEMGLFGRKTYSSLKLGRRMGEA